MLGLILCIGMSFTAFDLSNAKPLIFKDKSLNYLWNRISKECGFR